MEKIPTKDAFKNLRDKYIKEIIPLYANNPHRFLVEEQSRLQDISDKDIDSMDLASGEDGSRAAYKLLKGLCSKKLPAILAQFPNRESAYEAFYMASMIASALGDVTATELTAEVFLRYKDSPGKLEEIMDSQEDLGDVRAYIDSLKEYLKENP